MTPKQLRSAAHALRTAANALEDVTAQLRTLSTEIDTPAAPVAPTAKHVWWDGEVFARRADGSYISATRTRPRGYSGTSVFTREAVPVKIFNALTGAEVGE